MEHSELKDRIQGLNEIDEFNFYMLKLFFKSLRNCYATLYDLVLKNFDKLKNPRSTTQVPLSFFCRFCFKHHFYFYGMKSAQHEHVIPVLFKSIDRIMPKNRQIKIILLWVKTLYFRVQKS